MIRSFTLLIAEILYIFLPRCFKPQNIKNLQLLKSLAQEHEVFILSSYPRSGSTWFRILICDYLSQLQLRDSSSTLQKIRQVNRLFPDIEEKFIAKDDIINFEGKIFFKSHLNLSLLSLILNPSRNKNIKFIYSYRDPVDMIESYYSYSKLKNRNKILRFLGQTVFAAYSSRVVRSHLLSACHALNTIPNNVFLIEFKFLKLNTYQTIESVLQFAGLPVRSVFLNNSIASTNINKLRTAERSVNVNLANQAFFRHGNIGAAYKLLHSRSLKLIAKLCAKPYCILSLACVAQQ
ncbi:sulfotransferase domain-containing protein [Synechococcus sp. UW140]|uniref:sulfotransferase domain-containing protein n=1 Tax=Synechococcus sp. UW140 TaxID=368503 RepID=UPI000E0EF2BB|nr:sulfotransferase domain-containing protein [Synechococcus sp. UW140]